MPRIGQYRGALEAQATRSIGVDVSIGSVSAQAEGWRGMLFPTFELRDVVLHDEDKREALRLARVLATVSPRSLWRLSFERLYIERPEVEVRLDALGKLHVAGLSMGTETSGESRSADWVFSQREIAIEGGTVRWTDERRGAPPLLLSEVSFSARNSARRHALGLDATPPAGWGERISLRGSFRQPLLSTRSGNWHEWDGQVYADLPNIDISRIGRYVSLDAKVREGNGALRAWGDVRKGALVGVALDMGLKSVDITLDEKLQPLVLRSLTGRLAVREEADHTMEVSTTGLAFETSDGVRWPGGNLWLSHTPATGRTAGRGAIKADRLDLAMLAQIANRLPLGARLHDVLASHAPTGLVEQVDAQWDGPPESPTRYQARGKISNLFLAALPAEQPEHGGQPGVSGATVDFEATQAGGSASISMGRGSLTFPGVFEDPLVPIDELSARATWKVDGPRVQVQLPNLRFANADAQGEARISWRTADPATSSSHSRFPGVLDMDGRLTRADGTRVHRYLPLHIPKETRDYVRDAVTAGTASAVDFRVKGDLWDMPFPDAKQGDFRIAARVADVHYAYVPAHDGHGTRSAGAPEPAWPALTGASGELVFERASMKVRNARGRLAGAPGIELTRGDAEIADLMHHAPQLKLNLQAGGPLGELLKVAAPLAGPARDMVAQMRAGGRADYKLQLELPLSDMDKTRLQASVGLQDNDLQITPDTPPISQARGLLNFTDTGFSLANVRARVLGGDVRLEGKGRYAGAGHDLSFKAQGVVSAEGLRSQREFGWLADLGRKMNGSTAYTLDYGVRDGISEFALASNLQGLGLQLPAPLAKAPEDSLAFSVEKKVVLRETASKGNASPRIQDRLSVGLGRIASATWLRDISGSDPKVINGGIGMGLAPGENVVSPERDVLANLNLARFDVGAWRTVFQQATGGGGGGASASGGGPVDADASPYLPSVIALRAQELRFGARHLTNVVLGGSREGTLWRANVDSDELSGYLEYGQAQAGRVMARLARLKIARTEANEVESLLDEQASTLPALDIVVDDFELYGRKLGRAEVEAVNRGSGGSREWRLNRMKLTTPEATFAAQGSWAAVRGAEARRTSMDFTLDISDAGALLNRLGMQDVLRRGRGKLEGEVGWRGSPFALDYPSMDGKLHIDVTQGQFLKADPGIAKLLGVLSLQALPRRFTLDFRDVFSQGFAFDFVRGDATIAKGVASTNNMQMKGVNAAVLMDGSADLGQETTDLRVVVVPEISAGTAALVATAINPAIGLATFLAQYALSKPLSAATTQEFQIEGAWADPKITKVPRRFAFEAPPDQQLLQPQQPQQPKQKAENKP